MRVNDSLSMIIDIVFDNTPAQERITPRLIIRWMASSGISFQRTLAISIPNDCFCDGKIVTTTALTVDTLLLLYDDRYK